MPTLPLDHTWPAIHSTVSAPSRPSCVAPDHEVAFGVTGAARVGVDDRVALLAPVGRVGPLEAGHLGDGLGRNAEDLPGLGAVAGTFAEEAPGQDRGQVGESLGPSRDGRCPRRS